MRACGPTCALPFFTCSSQTRRRSCLAGVRTAIAVGRSALMPRPVPLQTRAVWSVRPGPIDMRRRLPLKIRWGGAEESVTLSTPITCVGGTARRIHVIFPSYYPFTGYHVLFVDSAFLNMFIALRCKCMGTWAHHAVVPCRQVNYLHQCEWFSRERAGASRERCLLLRCRKGCLFYVCHVRLFSLPRLVSTSILPPVFFTHCATRNITKGKSTRRSCTRSRIHLFLHSGPPCAMTVEESATQHKRPHNIRGVHCVFVVDFWWFLDRHYICLFFLAGPLTCLMRRPSTRY